MCRKHLYLPIFLLLLLSGHLAFGQCAPGYFEYLDQNKVKARMHNGADHFWDLRGEAGYEVPVGSGRHSAFASSMWIGGLDQTNTLHVAANTYRQTGIDFFAGPYRTGGNYVCGRGFISPATPFDRSPLVLASGKVLSIYSNGFTVYDPVSNSTQNRFLPTVRNTYDAVELPDGRVLLYGDDVYPVKSDAMIIDTAGFNIQIIGQLNHFHKWSSATVLSNGMVLIAGVDGCELFDPATNNSTVAPAMGSIRLAHPAILMNNGKVLVAGGATNLGGGGNQTGTELYDPATNTWSAGPALNIPRGQASFAEMSSGSILIIGGAYTATDFEVYDPVANTIGQVPGLSEEVDNHRSLLLSTGEVLIALETLNSGYFQLVKYDPSNNTYVSSHHQIFGIRLASMGAGEVLIDRGPNNHLYYNPAQDRLVDQPWEYMWKVSKAQIDQFIIDHTNNAVNFANYPDIETWPAHGDVAAGEDFHLAPFVDVNQNGLYRPLQDGDYPCIEGDQALWWAYNDDGQHTETSGNAMGIQVEQMSYAYDCGSTPCTPDSALDYTTFHHLEITNKSSNNYTQVYIGVWLDVDIGNFSDDYVGSDTSLGLGFAYNGAPTDPTAYGYGTNPPAMGTIFLDNGKIGKSTNFMYYENDFSLRGNPESAVHYYNYMRSIWKDGSPLMNNGSNGFPGTGTGPVVSSIYPGDPGFCGGTGNGGWSEVSAGNTPFDRRFLQSFGPFDLAVGEKIDLDYAVVWARGYYNDNLGSVCELKTAAAAVDSFWHAQSRGCFNIVLNQEEELEAKVGWGIYPNPNQGRFVVEFENALRSQANLTVYDIAGRPVHQQSLSAANRRFEVATQNLAAGVYIVRVNGDNLQLTRKMILRH